MVLAGCSHSGGPLGLISELFGHGFFILLGLREDVLSDVAIIRM